MARQVSSTADSTDLGINMTSMIDIVFQLLLFFMVVIDLGKKEIENLTLPKAIKSEEDKGKDNERRVIINILKAKEYDQTKDVEVKIKGKIFKLDALKEELFIHAETKRDPTDSSGNSPSEIFVLIRCDKDIRWREVQWVMQACADPAVRIYKLQFATADLKED